jgi:Cellulase (glycosyl hydrolase family 5)
MRNGKITVIVSAVLAALAAGILAMTSDGATAPPGRPALEVALQDDAVFVSQAYFGRDRALDRARQLNVSWIRANVIWADVLGRGQAKARHRPKRVRYAWRSFDQLIDAAAARGMHVELTLSGPSPAWATSNHKVGPRSPNIGAWKQFVRAAVTHFKGRVPRYTIWNEPNLASWLQPTRWAPYLYRSIYQAAWGQIRQVDPTATVLIGETNSWSLPHHAAWSPLTFIRAMSCVDGRYRRLRGCPGRLVADGYAEHPYDYRHAPSYRYPVADDVTLGTLGRLTTALDRLRRARALVTPNGRPMSLYLTEYGYFAGGKGRPRMPESRRAAYLRQAFSIAAANRRVRQMLWYQLVQPPRKSPWRGWQTYLILSSGRLRDSFVKLLAWTGTAGKQGRIEDPSGPIPLPPAPRR